MDGSRRSPGFASEDDWQDLRLHPESPAAFPVSQWPRAMSSLTVARQRGICTRFPVFAERQRRAFRRYAKERKLRNDECNGSGGGTSNVGGTHQPPARSMSVMGILQQSSSLWTFKQNRSRYNCADASTTEVGHPWSKSCSVGCAMCVSRRCMMEVATSRGRAGGRLGSGCNGMGEVEVSILRAAETS